MKSFFVYIIYSTGYDKYYKGFSTDVIKRLFRHNNKGSQYTSSFTPWKLVYVESFHDKTKALKREKSLKKYSKVQIKELMLSQKNILDDFNMMLGE